MTITGFKCISENLSMLNCDAYGNNAAISCPDCDYPVLFVARKNQKGFDAAHTTTCLGCGKSFFIEILDEKKIIKLHESK